MKKPLLLSPVGKPDSLYAAVRCGADEIYLGSKLFSARKNATNFSWEEIKEATKYCHTRNVKVHLALNTLVHDTELSDVEKCVIKAGESGIDAIITADFGVSDIIRTVCPSIEIHASTQLTSSNIYDVEALRKRGFKRVVLSRELSVDEIRQIRKNTDAELEVFVHGALCVSLSGKCLMSSFIGKRSGNRGECAQPCRQLYCFRNRKGYFLSPKDLCLADEIRTLSEIGIDSLKIEGRMKSPEYVACVTSIYRKYIDNPSSLTKEDEDYLKAVFVRGDDFTKGYFSSVNTPDNMNYYKSNDNITLNISAEASKRARNSFKDSVEPKRVPIDADLKISANETYLILSDGKNTVKSVGENAEIAKNVPITKETCEKSICKLGSTPYILNNFSCDIEENVALSVSSINNMRRTACSKLDKLRSLQPECIFFPYTYPKPLQRNHTGKLKICAQISDAKQFSACLNADKILVPLYLWHKITPNDKCALLLPQVVFDIEKLKNILSDIDNLNEVYVSTLGMRDLLNSIGLKVCADFSMNIFNSISSTKLSSDFSSITLSPELSLGDIKKIRENTDANLECICYGNQIVMTSRSCIIRGITGKCDCSEPIKIKDKTGAEFVVFGDSLSHLNTIVNSRPTFMADKIKEIKKSGIDTMRLIFTTESNNEIKNIINMYNTSSQPVKPKAYTRGYFVIK